VSRSALVLGDYVVPTVLYTGATILARSVGFRMRIPWDFYQLLDARSLLEHPLGSLCLMHHQPPGLNALLAMVLTVATYVGRTPETVAAALFVALGLVGAIVLYGLAVRVTGSRALAIVALLFVLTDPAYQVYANLFFYEFPLYVLHLLLLGAALWYLAEGRGLLLVGLLAATITATRTLFHPIWALGVFALVVWLRSRVAPSTPAVARRRVLVLFVTVVVAISLWPIKNWIVFGRGFYATLSSYSLARGLRGCGDESFNLYTQTGVAPPEVTERAQRPIALCGDAASDVLISSTKVGGYRNWNHVALLAAAGGFDRCSTAWRKDHPLEWLWRTAGQYPMWMRGGYVQPYDQSIVGPSNEAYYGYTLRYDRILYADLRPLAERWHPGWTLHQTASIRGRSVPYSLFGFVVFPLTVALVLLRWLRGPWTFRDAAVAVALFSIAWAMLGACATDGIEGNRMRFSTTGLFAVVLVYALPALPDLLRARRHDP
jgi:hypothetical protein